MSTTSQQNPPAATTAAPSHHLREWAEKVAQAAPPLTTDQTEQLARLLRPHVVAMHRRRRSIGGSTSALHG